MHLIQTNPGLFAFIGDMQELVSLVDGGSTERTQDWA